MQDSADEGLARSCFGLKDPPSRRAVSPVKACQRSIATSTYCGISSIAWQARPVISAAVLA